MVKLLVRAVWLVCLAAFLLPGTAGAETLAMPTGPASMAGLGPGFGVSSATGMGSFSLPIEVPPGFVAPSLSLDYASGSGRDIVGLSFELPITSIYRTTNRGAPNFDENDRFAVEGGLSGELVRVNAARGYYRLRNEGPNALFVRDVQKDTWEIRYPDGTRQLLGTSLASQQKSQGRTFRWYLAKESDVFEHAAFYRYVADQGKVYLSQIDYQGHAQGKSNRISFEYQSRPDAFLDYSSGDEVVTARRLTKIVVVHGTRTIRSYGLTYEEGLLFSLLRSVQLTGENGENLPPLTLSYYKTEANRQGVVKMVAPPPLEGLVDGAATFEDVNRDGLEDIVVGLSGEYSYYENLDGKTWGRAIALAGSPDRGLYEDDVLFADMDGDGDRDVVERHAQDFRYFPALAVSSGRFPGFGPAVTLTSDEGDFHLQDPEVKLADLNYDGRIDVLMQTPSSDLWLVNRNDHLASRIVPKLPTDVLFHDERLQYLDFNGDGTSDFVRIDVTSTRPSIRVWFGFGGGRFSASRELRNVPPAGENELTLQDLNNDGQADLVHTSGSWATYYLNNGSFGFTDPVAHYYGLPSELDTQKRLFADLNGNGTTDLVWVTYAGELYTLDLIGQPFNGLLRTVDNGMGLVTTLTYRSSTDYVVEHRRQGKRWRTTLPTPVPVIASIDTTDSLDLLGPGFQAQRTHSEYAYADGHYDGVRKVFRGFGEVDVVEPGDAYHEGLRTRTLFHVGQNLTTGADEEVLANKPYAEMSYGERGELYSSVETLWEIKWLCQSGVTGEAREVFPGCTGNEVYARDKDRLVSVALATAILSGSWEKSSAPRFSASRSFYNGWGDEVRSDALGEVKLAGSLHKPGEPWSVADLPLPAHSLVTESELLYDVGRWRVGIAFAAEQRDAQGNKLAQTQTFFDGAPFVGLVRGSLTYGLPSRTQALLAEENRWVDTSRSKYNEHGQVVATLDATGVRSEVDYDSATGLFVAAQRAFLGAIKAETRATYDAAYGHVLTTRDPNGAERTAHYDGLGRVTGLVDPFGDLVTKYTYEMAKSTHPLSVVRVGTLRVRGRDQYDMSYAYVDAMGHTRQVKEEADELGYVASGWVELSVRGAARRAYQPFATSSPGFERPPEATPFTRSHYDALSRVVRAELPAPSQVGAATELRTEYLPFEVHSYNERASNEPQSAFPAILRLDGFGRAYEQERVNTSEAGGLEPLVWSQVFDPLGRVTRFRDPEWQRAPEGASRARHERRYTYDSLGRMRELYDANLGRLAYGYDDVGRPLTRTDALGQVRRVQYDYASAGRPVLQSFEEDAGGRPDYAYRLHYDVADPKGPLADATHLVGKLAWAEHPTGSSHISYDKLGLPDRAATSLWDPSRSSFLQQQRDVFARSVRYDPQGQPTELSLPEGLEIALEYDTRGLLRAVRGDFGAGSRTVYDGAHYDALGTLRSVDQGNGTRTCNARDERGRRTKALTGRAASTDCGAMSSSQAFRHLGYQYTYDNLLASITDLRPVRAGGVRLDQRFRYDLLQQLTHVDATRGSYDYAYDRIQNLTAQRASSGVQGISLGFFRYGEDTEGPNRVTSFCANELCQSGERFSYDAAGRLTRYHGYELTYDVQGQLVRAHKPGVSQVEYYYDHAGERVLVVHKPEGKPARVIREPFEGYEERDGEKIWTIAGPEGEAEVTRSRGVRVDLYLLDQLSAYVASGGVGPKPLAQEYLDLDRDGDGFDAGDLQVARTAYEEEKRAGGRREVWRWVHPDHLVTASHVSDSTGELVFQTSFHPYGVEAERNGVSGVKGYAAGDRESDVDLGLQRFGARYYAADLGRWITADEWIGESPARMWGRARESSLYTYVSGDPANKRDPTGREEVEFSKREQVEAKVPEPDSNYRYRYFGSKFAWSTDGAGRVVVAQAESLQFGTSHRNPLQTEIGDGDDARDDDIGGHLIGDQFGGPTSRLNVVPLNKKLNIAGFKSFENMLAGAVKSGWKVDVKFELEYDDDESTRPDRIKAIYQFTDQHGKKAGGTATFENEKPTRKRSFKAKVPQ